MALIEAQYLNGVSVQVESETVGGIMVHFANLHQRFASDVAVVCPDTWRDLTEQPWQTPPRVVRVVVKYDETEKPTVECLLLTLELHAQHEDIETCARAYKMLCAKYKEKKKWASSEFLNLLNKKQGYGDREEKIVSMLRHLGPVHLRHFLDDACIKGNEKTAKILLSHGVPVNYDYDVYELEPLSKAAEKGHAGTVKVLLEHKADIDRETSHRLSSESGTALSFAAAGGHADVVRILLDHKAYAGECGTKWPLGDACKMWNTEIAEMLLLHLANLNYKALHSPDTFTFALNQACEQISIMTNREEPDMLQLLLKHKADVNIPDSKGRSPLMITVDTTAWDSSKSSAFLVSAMKLLICHHADVNFQRRDGPGVLHFASRRGILDAVDVLVRHGANVNLETDWGFTPLMDAALANFENVVNLLLTSKANVNHQAFWGETVLDFVPACNTDLAKVLRDHGALEHGSAELKERRATPHESLIELKKVNVAVTEAKKKLVAAKNKYDSSADTETREELISAHEEVKRCVQNEKKTLAAHRKTVAEAKERHMLLRPVHPLLTSERKKHRVRED